ncbi:hypothetical protein BLNAU_11639 [Blattamonas nauphoetae]|uniref:DDE-1 domain-containing protein n=1 Tax=Blattamonas nauphoetae TaxID=2049346 RepID=A0ABQ9XP95_9EUKA|nr:hypothetical protein BLNAU_11639 [Blattamonas nauphoetae]
MNQPDPNAAVEENRRRRRKQPYKPRLDRFQKQEGGWMRVRDVDFPGCRGEAAKGLSRCHAPCNSTRLELGKKFIKGYADFILRRPQIVDEARIRARTRNNLTPFYALVQDLFQLHRYRPELVFNMDETSSTTKFQHRTLRVGTRGHPHVMTRERTRVSALTLLIVIGGDGTRLDTHILVPQRMWFPTLDDYHPRGFTYHSTATGWMTTDIHNKRREEIRPPDNPLGAPPERCLIVLDGHSSRINRGLWLGVRDKNIDVVVLPANTSAWTQPCDKWVNANLKRQFTQLTPIPSERDRPAQMIPWLERIQAYVRRATDEAHIRASWRETGLIPLNPEVVLEGLPLGHHVVLPPNRLSLSSELITSEAFMQRWAAHDQHHGRELHVYNQHQEIQAVLLELGLDYDVNDLVIPELVNEDDDERTDDSNEVIDEGAERRRRNLRLERRSPSTQEESDDGEYTRHAVEGPGVQKVIARK